MSQPPFQAFEARLTPLEDAVLAFAGDVLKTHGFLNSGNDERLLAAVEAARARFVAVTIKGSADNSRETPLGAL